MTQNVIPAITIGADPEVFVRHLPSGRIVSAHDLLPGTKAEPFKVPKGAIQVDGVAGEFNIDPAPDYGVFMHNIDAVMKNLKNRLGESHAIVIEPTAMFDKTYFAMLPVATRELGCNPDYNAWTGQVNEPPEAPDGDMVMRTAAGHIHAGYDKDMDVRDPLVFADACIVAQQLDYYIGIWSLLWDPDATRRQMYGKAGSMRPKPYGMEYRALSNRWLETRALQKWVFDATYHGIQALFAGQSMAKKYGDTARKIIDENITDWNTLKEFTPLKTSMGMGPPPVGAETKSSLKGYLAGGGNPYMGLSVAGETWANLTTL